MLTTVNFDSANAQAIIGKLKDFNPTVPDTDQLDAQSFELLEQLLLSVGNSGTPNTQQMAVLWKTLQWPIGKSWVLLQAIVREITKYRLEEDTVCQSNLPDDFTKEKSWLHHLESLILCVLLCSEQFWCHTCTVSLHAKWKIMGRQ